MGTRSAVRTPHTFADPRPPCQTAASGPGLTVGTVIAKVEPLTPARALRGPFDYRIPGEMAEVGVGSMLVVPFGRRRLLGVVVGLAEESELPPERLVEPLTALESGVPAELVRLGLWVADEYCSTPARGLALVLPPGTGPAGLPRVGVRLALTPSLTEVYLRAVAAALRRGRSAIVLAPEIALTPQTAARFEERFGDTVAILHSRLGQGERHDEWMRLRRGEARVCVGPRSAVFAPVGDLGLIVIDEEHDSSYKQEGDPRYDARRVAERRAEQSGAVLVAGSATPRPESVLRLERLSLPDRVDGRPLPPVELVGSLEAEGVLHERTLDALATVRDRREKAIVLLNRRGWSNFLSCRSCGQVWRCRHCDVSLVLHRTSGRVACHHCGHSEAVPAACPDCGSVSLARHGVGTERLEHELARQLSPLPVFRLDADSAGDRGAVPALL